MVSTQRPKPILVFRVELVCLLCADNIGVLETRRWPSLGPAMLHAGGQPPMSVVNWSRLHCERCGGNVYADEVSTSWVYPPEAWQELDRPRRGRPPRWLVAERQAARLEADRE